MDKPNEVRRDCMRANIRRSLVQRILDGTYKPGDRLLELQIAREFQSSQGPVREALRELEALRLVESKTYRGTRVRAIGETELWECAQVRGALEECAARTAAATLKTDLTSLLETLEKLRETAAVRDLDGYARENRTFHRTIVIASGNSVLLRVWDSLMLEVRTRIGLSQHSLNLPVVAETHVPILEAFARGDGEEAGRLLRDHAELFARDPGDPYVVRPDVPSEPSPSASSAPSSQA